MCKTFYTVILKGDIVWCMLGTNLAWMVESVVYDFSVLQFTSRIICLLLAFSVLQTTWSPVNGSLSFQHWVSCILVVKKKHPVLIVSGGKEIQSHRKCSWRPWIQLLLIKIQNCIECITSYYFFSYLYLSWW